MSTVPISEKFVSIQGEGPYAGEPASFIRTGYCNLHCEWCDAWYTWDHRKVDVKETCPPEDTIDLARWIRNQGNTLVVLTGGEPLMWEKELYEVVMLGGPKHLYQFETNGTIVPNETPLGQMDRVKWVVSPKLSNNGVDSFTKRISHAALRWFEKRDAKFKFVVREMRDFSEVQALAINSDNEIYIMPCATTAAELTEAMQWIIPECIRRGWTYTDRLHIRAWGDKRGT